MSIIRQGSLFDMQDFYELEPSKRFEAVFSVLFVMSLWQSMRLILSLETVQPHKKRSLSKNQKKRGRKPKAEQEAFKLEVQERENQKSIYEKTIEAQLPISLETLQSEAPLEPNWGIKKNSEGKNTFWLVSFTLVYNATKLAVDRINKQMKEIKLAA